MTGAGGGDSPPSPPQTADAVSRLAAARVARLATITPGGFPHVVPVCFVMADDVLWSVVDEKPKRTRTGLRRLVNIESNPRVALLVDHYEEDWKRLWFVRVDCNASIVTDEGEFERALARLRDKYEQYRAMPLAFATHPMIRMQVRRVVEWSAS